MMESVFRNESGDRSESGEGNYRTYPSRWTALALFCSLEMANALLWVSFAPISDISGHYFSSGNFYSSVTAVNMLANVFLIVFPFGTIGAVYTVKHFRPRNALIFAGFLTALGALLRCLAAYFKNNLGNGGTYGLFILGQLLGAFAQPYFTNFAPALSGIWFAVDERDISTSIGAMCSPLGNAIGQLIPPILVSEEENSEGDYHVKGMTALMFVEFLLCVIPLVFAYFFLKDAPPSPPSHSTKMKLLGNSTLQSNVRDTEDVDDEMETLNQPLDTSFRHSQSVVTVTSRSAKQPSSKSNDQGQGEVWDDVKKLAANRDFLLLAAAFCIGVGFFNSIMTLLNQIVGPFGYTNDDAGYFGAVFIISGLIGAGIMGKVLETTKAYITVLRVGIFLAGGSNFLCFGLLYKNNFWPLMVCFSILGMCVLPLLPAMLENCAECTYPIPEELSAGILYSGSNLSALGFIFALQFLLEEPRLGPPPLLPSTIFIFAILILAGVFVALYHGEYKRQKSEMLHSKAAVDSESQKGGRYLPPDNGNNNENLHLVRVSSNDNSTNPRISTFTGTSGSMWNSKGVSPPSPSQSHSSNYNASQRINNPIQQLVVAAASSSS